MVPDKLVESAVVLDQIAESSPALVIQHQLARERPCPSSPPSPWLSSSSPHPGRVLDSSRRGLPTVSNELENFETSTTLNMARILGRTAELLDSAKAEA